jgi:hypothetical protein
MSTKLPKDNNGNPIPVLRFLQGGARNLATSASSARISTPFSAGTKVVGLYATQDVFLRFGDSSVTAGTSDHFLPAGLYYDVAIGVDDEAHYTHLAAIRVSASGTLYISEKE